MWDTVLPESVVERISMTGGGEDGALEESAALRLVMWELARGLFSSNPILGIGYQGFIYASADQPLHNVHNYYLQTASEQGVIGIVLLAGTLLLGVFTGFKLWRKATTPFLKGMGLGTLGYSVCVVVVNVFGDRYSQLAMGSYFFLLLGASVRMLRLSQPLPVVPAPLPLRRLPALRLRRRPPAGPDVDADVVDVVPTGVHHA
jgi:O-antigen ligase